MGLINSLLWTKKSNYNVLVARSLWWGLEGNAIIFKYLCVNIILKWCDDFYTESFGHPHNVTMLMEPHNNISGSTHVSQFLYSRASSSSPLLIPHVRHPQPRPPTKTGFIKISPALWAPISARFIPEPPIQCPTSDHVTTHYTDGWKVPLNKIKKLRRQGPAVQWEKGDPVTWHGP